MAAKRSGSAPCAKAAAAMHPAAAMDRYSLLTLPSISQPRGGFLCGVSALVEKQHIPPHRPPVFARRQSVTPAKRLRKVALVGKARFQGHAYQRQIALRQQSRRAL